MQKLTLVVALIGFAAMITGCSKDHDLDDYKQEQFQKDYSKVSAAAGRYSGVLTSASTGKTLCALQITLRPNAKLSKGSGDASDTVTPSLTAEVEFAGASEHTTVAVEGATYIDQAHLFHGELSVPSDVGVATAAVTIDINGNVGDDGSMTGSLVAEGYGDEGGTFKLTRNGSNVDKLAKTLGLSPEGVFAAGDESASHNYVGTYTDSQGSIAAQLTVSSPPRTRLQELADLLAPSREKFYQMNFKEGGNYSIDFLVAEYDQGQHRLKAAQTKALQGGQVNAVYSIICSQYTFADGPYNFSCTWTSNLLGEPAQLEFHSP